MKRMIAAVAALMVLFSHACFAEPVKPDNKVFETAKACVQLLVSGSYDKAVAEYHLPLSAKQISEQVKAFRGSVVQSDYLFDVAVSWYDGNCVYLAVPTDVPHDNAVPAFVFSLSDDCAVTGLQLVFWKDVETAYKAASGVIWNKEYNPGFIVVLD